MRSLFVDREKPTIDSYLDDLLSNLRPRLHRKIFDFLKPESSYKVDPPSGGSYIDSREEFALISPESLKRVREILKAVPEMDDLIITDEILKIALYEF